MLKKHKQGKCPVCGSKEIQKCDFETKGNKTLFNILECTECGTKFKEEYELVFKKNHVDKKGKTNKNHKKGRCPECGSDALEYGEIEIDDEGCTYPVECMECNATFDEAYKFVFDGQYNIEKNEGIEND